MSNLIREWFYKNRKLIVEETDLNLIKSRAARCNQQGYIGFENVDEKLVTPLQNSLVQKGLLSPDAVNGMFDDKTLAAVLKFQEENNLKVDGCVGPKTAKKLNTVSKQEKSLKKKPDVGQLAALENFTPKEKVGEVISGSLMVSPNKSTRFITTPTETRIGGTLAWRNHNPGNLRLRTAWKSYGAVGRAFGFATFETFEDGYRALKTYIDKFGFSSEKHTIASFMRMYAPAQDSNNPSSYAAKIAKSLRASVDDKMSSFKGNEEALEVFAQAIKKVEGTREGKTIKQITTASFDGASKGSMIA